MNRFLDISYWHYRLNEAKQFDYNKFISLRKERSQLYKDFCKEQDNKKRRRIQLQMKIIDCKLAIENLNR